MRFAVPIAVATATAFSVSAMPVRAFPGASINLVRVNGDGVKALPGLQVDLTSPSTTPSANTLIAQAGLAGVNTLLTGTEDFQIQYNGPLPQFSSSDIIRLTNRATGEVVEEISLTSPKVSFSNGRRTLIISHDYTVPDGVVICALLPDGPNPLPNRTSPCCFTVVKAAVVEPTGKSFPWWIVPAVIGVGVGVCALAGCFNSSGGGGGNNDSSR